MASIQQLGIEIRERRRALNLSQQELAEMSGASERFVRNLEQGKATVRLDKLTDVLAVLGLELTAKLRRTQ